MVASLERGSEHPLGIAIVAEAEIKGLLLQKIAGFESLTGKGVMGTANQQPIAIGNAQLMLALDISLPDLDEKIMSYREREQGQSVMLIAIEQVFAGFIVVADPIKVSSQAAIPTLHDDGVRVVMLTGDNIVTARAVAK